MCVSLMPLVIMGPETNGLIFENLKYIDGAYNASSTSSCGGGSYYLSSVLTDSVYTAGTRDMAVPAMPASSMPVVLMDRSRDAKPALP